MTIGPDPMTRTLWISVRLGIGGVPVTRSADRSTPTASRAARARWRSVTPQKRRVADRRLSPAGWRHGHREGVVPQLTRDREGEGRPRTMSDRHRLPAALQGRIDREVDARDR